MKLDTTKVKASTRIPTLTYLDSLLCWSCGHASASPSPVHASFSQNLQTYLTTDWGTKQSIQRDVKTTKPAIPAVPSFLTPYYREGRNVNWYCNVKIVFWRRALTKFLEAVQEAGHSSNGQVPATAVAAEVAYLFISIRAGVGTKHK